MPQSDRDRVVDELLRQALAGGSSSSACIEPDTLAAWRERTLSTSESAIVEAHLADCDRCRSVVAALARTEPPAETSRPSGWTWQRWLTPVAAAAAAVTIWIVASEPADGPTIDSDGAAVQMASSEPASNAAEELEAIGLDRPAVQPGAAAEPSALEETRATAPVAPVPATSPVRPASATSATTPAAESEIASGARQEMAAAPPVAPGRAPASETLAIGEAGADAPAPPSPAAPAPSPEIVATPAVRAAADQAQSAQFRVAAPSPTAPVAGLPLVEFATPDGQVQWRVVDGQAARRTEDDETWRPVDVPAGVFVAAGSSPSPLVCWLVGRAGVVLLTTDGETFERLPSPSPDDLAQVSATDARIAIVTTANQEQYTTSDGGGTWQRSPDQ